MSNKRNIQKPYFHKNNITLYNGDALSVVPSLKTPADLVFTSPPYFNARNYSHFRSYEDYLSFLHTAVEGIHSCLKPNGIFVLNLSCVIEARQRRNQESTRWPIPFDAVPLVKLVGFKFLDDIIWQKPDGASTRAIKFSHHRRPVAYKPFPVTEYLLVFKRDDGGLLDGIIRSHSNEVIESSLVADGYERTNIWSIAPTTSKLHPSPFPLSLAVKVVRYYSFVGDLVLDPFAGSGTTLLAAMITGRQSIGVEQSLDFCVETVRRLEKEKLRFNPLCLAPSLDRNDRPESSVPCPGTAQRIRSTSIPRRAKPIAD